MLPPDVLHPQTCPTPVADVGCSHQTGIGSDAWAHWQCHVPRSGRQACIQIHPCIHAYMMRVSGSTYVVYVCMHACMTLVSGSLMMAASALSHEGCLSSSHCVCSRRRLISGGGFNRGPGDVEVCRRTPPQTHSRPSTHSADICSTPHCRHIPHEPMHPAHEPTPFV